MKRIIRLNTEDPTEKEVSADEFHYHHQGTVAMGCSRRVDLEFRNGKPTKVLTLTYDRTAIVNADFEEAHGI